MTSKLTDSAEQSAFSISPRFLRFRELTVKPGLQKKDRGFFRGLLPVEGSDKTLMLNDKSGLHHFRMQLKLAKENIKIDEEKYQAQLDYLAHLLQEDIDDNLIAYADLVTE